MTRYWLILAVVLVVCMGCGADGGEDVTVTLSADPPLELTTTAVFSISEDGVITVEGKVVDCECPVCEFMRERAMRDVERWLNEETS